MRSSLRNLSFRAETILATGERQSKNPGRDDEATKRMLRQSRRDSAESVPIKEAEADDLMFQTCHAPFSRAKGV